LGLPQQFNATGIYTNGPHDITNQVSWSSSNNTVATIDNNGLATTLALGIANITASLSGVKSQSQTLIIRPEVNKGHQKSEEKKSVKNTKIQPPKHKKEL
jgi:trimeric autotransporter adhesin